MARALRLEYPGAIYHITARGNAKEPVYLDDADRRRYLKLLGEVVRREGWVLYGYCLMNNHYHLLLETPEGNLSEGMRRLNGVYTQQFNRRHGRVGHVFQGRYKSRLVEKESYLLELCRYIALNPVRAGLVKDPKEWPWSSYRATAGMEQAVGSLQTEWILEQFGAGPEAANRYREFVLEGIGKEAPKGLRTGLMLGKEDYQAQVKAIFNEELSRPGGVRLQKKIGSPSLDELFRGYSDRKERDRRIYQAYSEHSYSQAEIARHLGLTISSICKIVKREKNSIFNA